MKILENMKNMSEKEVKAKQQDVTARNKIRFLRFDCTAFLQLYLYFYRQVNLWSGKNF